jgi:uncharacterized repeat protein (TIGR03803 family)
MDVGVFMHRNCSKRSVASWARGFAALGAALIMVAAAGSAAAAPTMTVLHSFTDDGFQATSVLIADSNGNLYGMAAHGGGSHGGVVFKLAPDGTAYAVLYSFCRLPSCSDGSTPEAGLIADSAGNLYGTTTGGGVETSLDAVRCSSSRRTGPRLCCTPSAVSLAATTGWAPKPA